LLDDFLSSVCFGLCVPASFPKRSAEKSVTVFYGRFLMSPRETLSCALRSCVVTHLKASGFRLPGHHVEDRLQSLLDCLFPDFRSLIAEYTPHDSIPTLNFVGDMIQKGDQIYISQLWQLGTNTFQAHRTEPYSENSDSCCVLSIVRTYYVADVVLECHPTAKSAAKVLKVKVLSSDNTENNFTADLFGYETPSQFRWVPLPSNFTKDKMLDGVAASFIEYAGNNGALDWHVEDLDKRISDFELLWKKKAFASALRAYGITSRLSLEQATLVLQEHYIVEPIMES
jgi:hypothetical protein